MLKMSEEDRLAHAYVAYRGMPREEAETLAQKYKQLFGKRVLAFHEFVKSELHSLRKEKRRFMRFKTAVKIGYRVLGNVGIGERVQTKDLSASGLAVLIEEKFPPGTYLELEIKVPDNKRPLYAVGRVVRQEEMNNRNNGPALYATGIDFVRIGMERQKRLIRYIFDTMRAKRMK